MVENDVVFAPPHCRWLQPQIKVMSPAQKRLHIYRFFIDSFDTGILCLVMGSGQWFKKITLMGLNMLYDCPVYIVE